MRASLPSVIVALAIFVASCSSGGAEPEDEPTGSANPAGGAAEPEVTTVRIPTVERIAAGEESALDAGPGEEQYHISSVASNGSTVLAVGSHVGADLKDRRPALLSSADGRAWTAGGQSLAERAWLNDVVAVGDELVVVGNVGEKPVVWPFADGKLDKPRPVAFSDGEGTPSAEAAVAVESRLYVLGLRLNVPGGPGPIDADNPPTASVVLTASDDQGNTWTPVEMPASLTPVESSNPLLEMLAGGGTGVVLTLTAHGDGVLVTVAVPGADGTVTTMWRLAADGTWADLGTTAELFDGQRLDLLHSHGESLMAFTGADDDASAWVSADGGVSFTQLDLPPSVLGGGGSQYVDAAASLDDGTLVVAGRTAGDWNGLQTSAETELWTTPDLETWNRALSDAALASGGEVWPRGVVALGDDVVIVGTHERLATTEEVNAHNEKAEDGHAPPPHPLARDAAAWMVSFEERPVVDRPAQATALDVTGLKGDVTISDVVEHDGRLVAAGWTTTKDDDDRDQSTAAIWTSADGESWRRVKAAAVGKPRGQKIHALITTDDGLVAVGEAKDGDTVAFGSWTSKDASSWRRADVAGEVLSAAGYDVTESADGLLAVGTRDSGDEDRYRSVGIWRSTDGGGTWNVVDTSGRPFRQRNVEVLMSVAVAPDGTLVAGGHTADGEDTERGFAYTPRSLVYESTDGETWTPFAAPYEGSFYSEVRQLVTVGDEIIALGPAGGTAEDLPGDPGVTTAGVSRRTGDGWSGPDEMFRHSSYPQDVVEAPFGTVLAGSWYRRAAGEYDVLLGLLDESGVTFLTDGLVIPGEEEASAAVLFGDRVIVLGTKTVEDKTTAVAWSVAGAAD